MATIGWLRQRPSPGCAREGNPAHKGTEEYNFFVAGLFPHHQVRIMGYDRVVKDLNGLTEKEFLSRIGESFVVSPESGLKSPSRPHEFGMYLGGKGFRLHVKEDKFRQKDLIRTLDVSLLQDNLLAPILGIHDPRADKRIKFVGGIRGVDSIRKNGRFEGVCSGLLPAPSLPHPADGRGRFRSDHAPQIHMVRTEIIERDLRPSPGLGLETSNNAR